MALHETKGNWSRLSKIWQPRLMTPGVLARHDSSKGFAFVIVRTTTWALGVKNGRSCLCDASALAMKIGRDRAAQEQIAAVECARCLHLRQQGHHFALILQARHITTTVTNMRFLELSSGVTCPNVKAGCQRTNPDHLPRVIITDPVTGDIEEMVFEAYRDAELDDIVDDLDGYSAAASHGLQV
eukprot:5497403-Amphidinium_carterae.5